MVKEHVFGECWLNCEWIPMGQDFTVMVFGGDVPHVGSGVMTEARPSLTGEGIGVTSSVINRLGHKDEVIARRYAEAIAIRAKCTVTCVCGIHIDHLTPEQLGIVEQAAERLLVRVLADMDH